MRVFLIFIIFMDFIFAKNLSEIVAIAYERNSDLKALVNSLRIEDENERISSTWQNPNIKLAVNDIRFDDLSARDLEPMQTQSVVVTQKIPLTSKFSILNKISTENRKIANKQLEVKRLKISMLIYENGYRFVVANKKLEVLQSYKKSLEKLLEIKKLFLQNSNARQKDIAETQISLSNIKIKINNLKTNKKNYLYNIENIIYQKLNTIEADIEVWQNLDELDIQKIIESHPYIEISKYKEIKSSHQVKLSDSNKIPDVALSLGYFQRENREDFAYVALSFPLPIYGTESSGVAKSNYRLLQSKEQLESAKYIYIRDIKSLINSAKNAYNNYKTIEEGIIPLNKFIKQDTLIGYQNSNDKITQLIKSRIEIDKSRLFAYNELEKYLIILARLSYYTTRVPK
jgi:outer membrane protein TolC